MGLGFTQYDLPVAVSMFKLAGTIANIDDERRHPFQVYMCLWASFNNIYTTNAFTVGRSGSLRRLPNGQVDTRDVEGLSMPRVDVPTEREQIVLVIREFDSDLRHRLISGKTTEFFVNRTPMWHGQAISQNALGQTLNGVLDVTRTVDPKYPVWYAIDRQAYAEYVSGKLRADTEDRLTRQIVFVLYGVRNNLFHGEKRAHFENDVGVVRNAIPLLRMIVGFFLS
jgi:hypothetical protein